MISLVSLFFIRYDFIMKVYLATHDLLCLATYDLLCIGLVSPASKVNVFSAGVVKLKAAAFQQRIQQQDSNLGKQECGILPSQAPVAAPASTATGLG